MDHVRIVEVGPRDGLQNEPSPVSLEDKIRLIEDLARAGVMHIEAGSFVSPKWVPQMANSDEVLKHVTRKTGVCYAALTPNLKGAQRALEGGADEIAIFTAASEAFSQKNINCSISESIERFKPVMNHAKAHDVRVRAYVSCVMGCPYEGDITPQAVAQVAQQLIELGCYEVSLGDTIGVGTPGSTKRLLEHLLDSFSPDQLAMHLHDTYGQALANTLCALEMGVRSFDASVAGLGGCPYAKGASGNVATEDLVYMLEGMGLSTGINLDALIKAGNQISLTLGRQSQSKVACARTPTQHCSQ
ncbi:MAG: hydroxymethylglutaryl-CoA lyase [Oleiphilaceae bacterium]|nr:hydroxymethylglutaryl-CoA lyase [Oleiphilaceae bacterium]